MAVSYEWGIETLDGNDVVDSDFSGRLNDFSASCISEGQRIVLIRNEGDDSEGLKDRCWAYVDGVTLDESFDGFPSLKVPKRFQKELDKWA